MMTEDPCLYYADEFAPQILLRSNSSINQSTSGGSDLLLSGMKPREPETMGRSRIRKNLVMISSCLFIFFLGFQSLQNLESTMNSEQGIGTKSQAVVFATAMVASLFLPDLLIKTYGAKRTLVCMILCSIPYFAANFNPKYAIIMPASIIMGMAIGPLSTVNAFYVNEMALRYLKVSPDETLENVLAKFYGFLSFFLENTQIWGNLISYFILRPGMVPIMNATNTSCGINFRIQDNTNPNLQPPSEDKRNLLVSIFILSAVIAAAVMGLFMDKLVNDVDNVERHEGKAKFIFYRLLAAVKHALKPNQILLLPLTIFVGMELAFYTGDFTKAYIACSWGVHHVGFVTVCFGVCGAIMALLVGPLVKCISQMAVLILAACANVATCILLFLWTPSPDSVTEYFLFAGVWGMGDAIWWSQVTALYGLMFPDDREAAFSNLYFWSFLGFFLSYSYANYFSVAVKINILLCFLITGMLGYLIGQVKIKCSTRREYVLIVDQEEG